LGRKKSSSGGSVARKEGRGKGVFRRSFPRLPQAKKGGGALGRERKEDGPLGKKREKKKRHRKTVFLR